MMNDLIRLKNCTDLRDLAALLHIPHKYLYFILYSTPIHTRYKNFTVPKKNGGTREILAPNQDLKIVQRALSNLLNNCLNIIETNKLNEATYASCIVSHAFRQKITIQTPTSKKNRTPLDETSLVLGIYSNAYKHKNKKYILNLDLKDFFHSITFNRIVGYFHKNEHFQLNLNVAITIAQIATYRQTIREEGILPQGSPCSPVISNLIAGILDNRLNRLAKKNKCTYTRYADDLTFSTNLQTFPKALFDQENQMVGKNLLKTIKDSWFELNPSKTRFTNNLNKQEVTGLTVNKKVNINSDYYRYTRSMVHHYCRNGDFEKSDYHKNHKIKNESSLSGILDYILSIKKRDFEKAKKLKNFDQLDSFEKLYTRFHVHKYFINNPNVNIICEGITDPLHLKLAYQQLFKEKICYLITSLEKIRPLNSVMGLSDGVTPMTEFLRQYHKINKSNFKNLQPCIILLDGDSEADQLINNIKSSFKQQKILDFTNFKDTDISLLKTINLINNLYIIQLPKNKCIEDIYDPSVLTLQLNGRTYNPSNKSFNLALFYGKKDLINQVIKPQKANINFDNFNFIFETIMHVRLYNYFKYSP